MGMSDEAAWEGDDARLKYLEEVLDSFLIKTPRTRPELAAIVEVILPLLESELQYIEGLASRSLGDEAFSTPEPHVEERLLVFGGLVYELSLVLVNWIEPAFEAKPAEWATPSEAAAGDIKKLVDLASRLPWQMFTPRVLGALRTAALGHSKRDTQEGYRDAWIHHDLAAKKLETFRDELGSGYLSEETKLQLKTHLDEVETQTLLSEVGTHCRRAEFYICRWMERVADGTVDADEQVEVLMSIEQQLRLGVQSGERSLGLIDTIEEGPGLVPVKTRRRLVVPGARHNPGIMTARAYLTLMPICSILEEEGITNPTPVSWERSEEVYEEGFLTAYGQIERQIERAQQDATDATAALRKSLGTHLRAVAQLRLHYGLLRPNATLPTVMDEISNPEVWCDDLHESTIRALSDWLQRDDNDANIIGSATMPIYIGSVQAVRSRTGDHRPTYIDWRTEWSGLDRFRKESRRSGFVAQALAEAVRESDGDDIW